MATNNSQRYEQYDSMGEVTPPRVPSRKVFTDGLGRASILGDEEGIKV